MLIAQVITDQTVKLQDYVIWHCDLNYFSDCEILASHMSSTQGPHIFSTQNPSVQHQKPLSSTMKTRQFNRPLGLTPKTPQFNTKKASPKNCGVELRGVLN